jgi:hypothetical protein
MSLYWAVLYHVEDNLSSLVVFVVDFDGQVAPYTDITPVVGPMIVETAQSLLAPSGTVGWQNEPASVFNYDPMAVRQAIYDEKAWAAIIINPNATVLLQAAVNNGNASYDPMGAAQVIYVEARDETTLDTYVVPQLQQFQTQATASFGREWASQVLSLVSSNSSVLTPSPQSRHRLLNLQPTPLPPANRYTRNNNWPHLPHHHSLLLLHLLPPHPQQVPPTTRPPTSQILPDDTLALDRDDNSLLLSLALLLPHLARVPDPVLCATCPSHRGCEPYNGLSLWQFPRLLDDQFRRHDCSRPGL